MKREAGLGESGFSLIELMIALVVTTIIAGAIFGLMASGQSTFRKEPELSDRQQNIRVGMTLIEGDVRDAGMEIPGLGMQIFYPLLNAVGPLDSSGKKVAGGIADFLQVVGNSGFCPSLDVCSPGNASSGGGVSITTKQTFPQCFALPSLVALFNNTDSGIFWGCGPGKAESGACQGGAGADNGHMILPPREKDFNPPGGPDFPPNGASIIEVVRYEIRIDSDGVPNLWRSPTGGADPGSSCKKQNVNVTGTNGWTIVARGIEDMQIQYKDGGPGGWMNEPRNISDTTVKDYTTVVQQVRVTLSARTLAATRFAGQTNSTLPGTGTGLGKSTAIRGDLTSTITPRAALLAISQAQVSLWR